MSFSIEIIKGEGRGDDSWAREVKFRNQKYFSFDGINVVCIRGIVSYESTITSRDEWNSARRVYKIRSITSRASVGTIDVTLTLR